MQTGSLNTFLQNLFFDGFAFHQKLSSMSVSNYEDLYFAIRALQFEFVESVDFMYNFLDVIKILSDLGKARNSGQLNQSLAKAFSQYIDFDLLSLKIKDQRTGVFYEMRGSLAD